MDEMDEGGEPWWGNMVSLLEKVARIPEDAEPREPGARRSQRHPSAADDEAMGPDVEMSDASEAWKEDLVPVMLHRVFCFDDNCQQPGCREMGASIGHANCTGIGCEALVCQAVRRLFPPQPPVAPPKFTVDDVFREAILASDARDEERLKYMEKKSEERREKRRMEQEERIFKRPTGTIRKKESNVKGGQTPEQKDEPCCSKSTS